MLFNLHSASYSPVKHECGSNCNNYQEMMRNVYYEGRPSITRSSSLSSSRCCARGYRSGSSPSASSSSKSFFVTGATTPERILTPGGARRFGVDLSTLALRNEIASSYFDWNLVLS